MSKQNKPIDNQMNEIHNQPDYTPQDRRGMRRMERLERRAEIRATRYTGGLGWLGGFVLIAIGAVFMLQNTGIIVPFTNWWALFLLIPAAGAFATAVALYERHRNWTAATGSLMGGLFLMLLAAAFLFGFNFGTFWPLILIAAGLLILAVPTLSHNKSIGEEK
jgi:hypothetical protein